MAAIWNAKSALQILQQCQPITDFKSATDYLWTKLNTYQLLSLYQELFPLEWEESQSEIYSEDESHSPKELEFISLVSEHLFPIDDIIEDIKFLASQWKKATQLLDKACELIDWIESNPNTNFSHILALWNLTLHLK